MASLSRRQRRDGTRCRHDWLPSHHLLTHYGCQRRISGLQRHVWCRERLGSRICHNSRPPDSRGGIQRRSKDHDKPPVLDAPLLEVSNDLVQSNHRGVSYSLLRNQKHNGQAVEAEMARGMKDLQLDEQPQTLPDGPPTSATLPTAKTHTTSGVLLSSKSDTYGQIRLDVRVGSDEFDNSSMDCTFSSSTESDLGSGRTRPTGS